MSIDEIILNYRNFLVVSWSCLSEILNELDWDESPYFLDEWMQANWELLVEKQIDEVDTLASYGYDGSSACRYSDKNRTVTHRVICWETEEETETKYIFLCFVTKKDGAYEIAPPFDYVSVENFATRERLALPLNKVKFSIEQVKKP